MSLNNLTEVQYITLELLILRKSRRVKLNFHDEPSNHLHILFCRIYWHSDYLQSLFCRIHWYNPDC